MLGILRFTDQIALRSHVDSNRETGNIADNSSLLSRIQTQQRQGWKRLRSNKNAVKEEKLVEFGWLMHQASTGKYLQLRSNKGGGTRKRKVATSTTIADIQTIAESTFFIDNTSIHGRLDDFHRCIVRFDQTPLQSNITLSHIYNTTGVTNLRLYLQTKRIVSTHILMYIYVVIIPVF